MPRILRAVVLAPLFQLFLACGEGGPAHIAYDGSETCAVCRMPVTDRRFGAQLQTHTGKAILFDSIECLVRHAATMAAGENAPRIWVPDFQRPGEMLAAETARFIRGARISSPMGQGTIALAGDAPAGSPAVAGLGGEELGWDGLLATAGTDPRSAGRTHDAYTTHGARTGS